MPFQLPSEFFSRDAQQGGFFPEAHVGIDIKNFGNRQNVLIEGIRGTGKTHILLMIQDYYINNFETLRVLPVYLSLAQINMYESNAEIYRMYMYTNIVKICIATLEKYKKSFNPDKNILENNTFAKIVSS